VNVREPSVVGDAIEDFKRASHPITNPKSVTEAFHVQEYLAGAQGRSWGGAKYFGTKLLKLPSDLWLYQEVVTEIKPSLIIETGTFSGGSALYFAHLLDQLSHGRVITIDLQEIQPSYPRHHRIEYWTGMSSTSDIIAKNARLDAEIEGGPVMVVLDSLHTMEHVLAELDIYAPLVSGGSYLVVEDTNVGPNDAVFPEHGPGPGDALRAWLPSHPDFRVDEARSGKFAYSYHTWVRRRRT
jgi:cephalosporin hydroxylase